MVEVINAHFGCVVAAPSEVHALLTTKWQRISVLAHAIHAGADDGWPKFTPKPERHGAQQATPTADAVRIERAIDIFDRARSGPHQC